ncbi:hypothetical protein C8F04DRAFT_1254955 [Mycena alexandri]|uniref:DUF6532 domain-containing protein n=1 Tax=Mycena alexandri TaxID=1745969 RepID=A0AAD6X5C2_9AGAR|nr:hypothetical protein C8F04DRAFT_1254955 [Mycena alexandri]
MNSKKTTKSKPRSTTNATKRTSATTKAKAAANKPKSTKKPKSTIEDDGFESEEPTANVAKAKGVPNKSKSAKEDDDYQDSQPGALAPLSQNFDGQPRPSRLKKQTLDRLKEEADAIYENPKRRKLTQTQLEDELENDAAPPAKKKRGVSNSQPQPAHPDSPLRLRLPPLRARAGTDSDDDFPAFPMPTMKRNLSVVYSDDDEDNNNGSENEERDKEMLDVDLFRDEKGMELHKQEMSEYMARYPPADLIDSDSMSALEDGHHPPDIYDASDIDEDEEERTGKEKDRRAEWNQWREGGEERKRKEQEQERQRQEQEQERKRQEQEEERKRQEQERRRQEGKRKRQEEALERGRQERMAQIQERERKRQEEEELELGRQERERKRQEEEELEQGRQERRAQIQEWEMQQDHKRKEREQQQERKQQQDRKRKELQEREQQLEEQEREKRRRQEGGQEKKQQGDDNRNNGQGHRGHGNDKHTHGRGHGGNEHRVLDRKGGPTDQDGGVGREQRDERERSKNESNNAKSKSSHSNSYNVLQKHHATNCPVLPPRNEDLAGCRQKQQGEGEEAEGGGEDSEEEDGEDSETEGKKSRKRRTAKDGPTPKQEHFYPKTWQKVFAFAKDHLFSYLLNDQLFPKQELSDKKLATFLHRSIAYCEEELKLDLEQQGTFYPEYEDEMLWGYVSNFRGKCKSMARAVVKEHYSLRIWPSHREFPKPAEYKAKTIANVTALLHESSFHIDGRDAKGRTNNFMAPAIGQLAYDILYTGKRPLGLQLPGDFQRYSPEFITAIVIFLRCAIQEHETGHFKNVDFTESRYSRAYRNGLRKMDTLRQNNVHSTKTMDQWEAWRLEHILKGGDEDEAGLSGDEINIQLD